MAHSCVEMFVHLIFSTKNRQPLIPGHMEYRLYGYLGGIAQKHQTPLLKINGTADHLHLLIKVHPTVALSVLVKEFKAYTSGWMKKEGITDFGWQEGYGAFSCSVTHVPQVIKYIANQKEHHKSKSFEQEIDVINQYWNTKWIVDDK